MLQLLQRIRAHPRIALSLLATTLLLAGLMALHGQAKREADARKGPDALQFERAPQAWLDHETSVSQFRKALDAGDVAAVGPASTPPGLVLFTRKGGDKASVLIPGCTVLGCAGTVFDPLGDRSAAAGFALVSIEVDPRTTSQRLLDTLDELLSPLLLLATIGVALVMATKLQTGMGGAASRLTVRPATQFADVVGSDEAKAGLNRVKAFMHDPSRYAKLGASAPRGVLLMGPPDAGKTSAEGAACHRRCPRRRPRPPSRLGGHGLRP